MRARDCFENSTLVPAAATKEQSGSVRMCRKREFRDWKVAEQWSQMNCCLLLVSWEEGGNFVDDDSTVRPDTVLSRVVEYKALLLRRHILFLCRDMNGLSTRKLETLAVRRKDVDVEAVMMPMMTQVVVFQPQRERLIALASGHTRFLFLVVSQNSCVSCSVAYLMPKGK